MMQETRSVSTLDITEWEALANQGKTEEMIKNEDVFLLTFYVSIFKSHVKSDILSVSLKEKKIEVCCGKKNFSILKQIIEVFRERVSSSFLKEDILLIQNESFCKISLYQEVIEPSLRRFASYLKANIKWGDLNKNVVLLSWNRGGFSAYDFYQMYLEKKGCDFTIKSSQNKEYSIHSAVLLLRGGAFFQNILEGNFKERENKTIHLQEFSDVVVEFFIKYIYLGYDSFLGEDKKYDIYDLFALYKFSDVYDLSELKKIASCLIKKTD